MVEPSAAVTMMSMALEPTLSDCAPLAEPLLAAAPPKVMVAPGSLALGVTVTPDTLLATDAVQVVPEEAKVGASVPAEMVSPLRVTSVEAGERRA